MFSRSHRTPSLPGEVVSDLSVDEWQRTVVSWGGGGEVGQDLQ